MVKPLPWLGTRWASRVARGARMILLAGLTLAACAAPAAPASKPAATVAPSGSTAPAAAEPNPAPPALIPVRAAYAAPAGALTPVWIAQDRGLFNEYGLDVDLSFLSGPRTDQGVITGEVPLGFGATVVNTRLGGGDIVAVAGI